MIWVGSNPFWRAWVRSSIDGQPGSGIRTKLINNFIAIAVCQINAEAFALAQKFGLDPAQTLTVVTGTTATNGHLTTAWPARYSLRRHRTGLPDRPGAQRSGTGTDAARQANVALPTGAAACESLTLACNIDDFAAKDFSALLDVACQLAQTDTIRL
ncbi:MAG: NAD-binding protein [Gammaproteobacteria bacterium]